VPIAECRNSGYSRHLQPIMLAVKASRPHVVDFMLSITTPAPLSLRDVKGSMPLHIAVKNGLIRITTSLLQFSEPRILYTEDGVGNTPLEIASLQHLLRITSKWEVKTTETWKTPPKISFLISDATAEHHESVEWPEVEAAETLSALVQSLDAEGCFTNKKELKDVLTEYAERTLKIARPPKKEEARTPEPQTHLGSQTESSDAVGTFKLIKNAVGHSTRRELVHLLDAQRAVSNALDKAINQDRNRLGYEAVNELGEDAVEKKQARLGLMEILREGYLYKKEEA